MLILNDGIESLGAAEPLGLLRDLRRAQRMIDTAVAAAVAEARKTGASWSQIGELLGMTKQSARQRFGSSVEESEPSRVGDEAIPHGRRVRRVESGVVPGGRRGKYSALTDWLQSETRDRVALTFDEVESLLNESGAAGGARIVLPLSARKWGTAYWSPSNPLGRAIKIAGWEAKEVESDRLVMKRLD